VARPADGQGWAYSFHAAAAFSWDHSQRTAGLSHSGHSNRWCTTSNGEVKVTSTGRRPHFGQRATSPPLNFLTMRECSLVMVIMSAPLRAAAVAMVKQPLRFGLQLKRLRSSHPVRVFLVRSYPGRIGPASS